MKSFLKKRSLQLRFKTTDRAWLLISTGSTFHNFGAAQIKARSPRVATGLFVRVVRGYLMEPPVYRSLETDDKRV